MRLALVNTRSGPQAARFVLLCNGLAARGHAVAAVCPPAVMPLLAPEVRPMPWRGAGRWWNPLAPASLAMALWEFRPDLVHAHGDRAAALTLPMARKLGRWPLVASLSDGAVSRGFAGRFDRVLLASPEGLEAFKAHHPGVPAEAVFPAAASLRIAEGAGRALRERLCVPWGAPVALVRMEGGKATTSNGMEELLMMWEGMGEAELWMAADDSPQARRLEAQCRNLGHLIEGGYDRGGQVNGIRWFGPREDRAALLDACDVAVLPACAGGRSASLAQALMADRPVVCAGSAWAAEILPSGFAVPTDDHCAWREALSAALADVAFAKEAQMEAFAHARREWTPEATAAQVEAAYEKALAG